MKLDVIAGRREKKLLMTSVYLYNEGKDDEKENGHDRRQRSRRVCCSQTE
jgi:hypothetical protein